jgi:hypothetical protein
MATALRVGIQPIASPEAIEKELIPIARPPLNLTHWPNPDGAAVKAARKRCVEEARQAESR